MIQVTDKLLSGVILIPILEPSCPIIIKYTVHTNHCKPYFNSMVVAMSNLSGNRQYVEGLASAYFPAAILLGRVPAETLGTELTIQACWIAGLFALNRLAFHYGVRRYGAFGG